MDASIVFQPRYPTKSAGFVFIIITLILVLVTIVFLLNIFVNDHSKTDPDYGQFNWVALFISVLLGIALFSVSLIAIRKFLSNQPMRVILEQTQMIVQDSNGKVLAIVPFAQVVNVSEAKQTLAKGQYEASYKQVLVIWQEREREDRIILSERDTTNFDALMDRVWELCPEDAREMRTYER